MEKSDNVVVIPLDVGWSDVGSWSALYDIGVKDGSGNVLKEDVIALGQILINRQVEYDE